jgi:hypothetical protein
MQQPDHEPLADQLEHEAAELQQQSEKLHGDVADVRDDWERKRREPNVPGAPEPTDPEGDEDTTAEGSPAPQAPPPEEGPAQSDTAPEGAVGPPKEQVEEGEDSA